MIFLKKIRKGKWKWDETTEFPGLPFTKVRFTRNVTNYRFGDNFVNIWPIFVIFSAYEKYCGVLHFTWKCLWKKWRFLRKKWRWKWRWKWKRNLKSSFSHTRYTYLSWLQICNWFFIRHIIPSTFSTGLGVFDAI